MRRVLVSAVTALLLFVLLTGCGTESVPKVLASAPPAPSVPPGVAARPRTMQPFHSDRELAAYLKDLAAKQRRAMRVSAQLASNYEAAPPPAAPKAGFASAGAKDESVTNVQHAGVDEGSIVKLHGNYLVVLRRGRLFTVSIQDGDLRPVSTSDAFGPDLDPRGTWYDEMLISNDTLAVIGYSYERGGTEVGLFHIDAKGKLTYQSTYHLRSNDYYSSRNYASRLIGTKLIFYAPMYMNAYGQDPFQGFPAVRKWHKGATSSEFRRILAAPQVYKPADAIDPDYGQTLHTVTTCDLASGDFDCKATSVFGPSGRVFYVSPKAIYVWVTRWAYDPSQTHTQSMIYRMPLDGSAPSALKVSGSPVDQFSFLESEDGYLNVLVRADGTGDSMWSAEKAAGSVALMRVALDAFSDGSAAVPALNYEKLPTPKGYTFQNRFVGGYLLYGSGSGWWGQQTGRSTLYAIRWKTGDWHDIALDHGTDRIEVMGSDAAVIGSNGKDLHFSAVSLGSVPQLADEYIQKQASQGELRSHGFFYKPEDEDSGMLGLPISVPARPGYRHLFESSAAIVFLKNDALHFRELGQLGADPENAKDDGCRASCVDWYGNSQPLFVRGRIIALLGYEMVEGSMDRGQIREMRRVNYASGLVISKR